jgi:photosystem II stability/assembly factor-like uncharacterized protein
MTFRRPVPILVLILSLFFVLAVSAAPVPPESYSALQWRLVGPLRGGWATCAMGVPGQPETFYIGTPDGGVWKTTDAGRTWTSLMDHEKTASIGALAVAASNPSVLWVGTGQVTTRWDMVSGNGVYRSRDGGKTWEQRGLTDSRHIGRVWIDPRNPDVVLVAALGHLFGANAERGIFRTADGGATWQKVLAVDELTGATDLASDPTAPDTLFASTWQMRNYPWLSYFSPNVGPGSGIWKSTDGGKTWARLAGHGLPEVPLGRIGLAVAPRGRVYATIDAVPATGVAGLYRSDDGGANWQRVNANASLSNAYSASVTIDPRNSDTIYAMGQSIRVSKDGGKTFDFFRGAPGGDDYHVLWIDPDHPERMITGSDQGAVVTVNGGASWSTWYNQPTGQFYHVATDDRFPYWIYSGQQDSGTVGVASRSDYGQLTFRDWHPVGGDERDYDIPFPGNADLVFGSGLGGRLTRWDAKTGQAQNVAPWPVSTYGQRPTSVRYRSTWLTPIAISPLPPHALYFGSQVLSRSNDQGQSWEFISPDLTGADPKYTAANLPADCTAEVVALSRARACGYGTISTIAPSPLAADTVWVGADDGMIHLTRDGGKTWQDVTPPGLADWSRIAQIDASPTSAESAYAAVDRHRADDFRPYLYVTHDAGKSWRAAVAGLPADGYVSVVRQDPKRPGLLFAGTQHGVFVSFDDGGSWQPLQHNLPTTGVNDLTIHGDDLIAATEGRSIWVLDAYTPLRHLNGPATEALLTPPAVAYRVSGNQNRDTPLPLDEPRAFNPPAGAILDYELPAGTRGPVLLEIADAQGKVVRGFRSDKTPERSESGRYFAADWVQPLRPLPAAAGHNRFVWDLRGPRPRAVDYEYSSFAVPGADTPELPQGLFVLPGTYQVRLTVDGKTQSQPLTVAMDPRVDVPPADLQAQHDFYQEVVATFEQVTDAQEQMAAVTRRLHQLDDELAAAGASAALRTLRDTAKHLTADVSALQGGGRRRAAQDSLAAVAAVLGPLTTDLESADRPPTGPQREVFAQYRQKAQAGIDRWKAMVDGPLRDLDRRVRAAGGKLAPVLP